MNTGKRVYNKLEGYAINSTHKEVVNRVERRISCEVDWLIESEMAIKTLGSSYRLRNSIEKKVMEENK
jgi:hypothetical protein